MLYVFVFVYVCVLLLKFCLWNLKSLFESVKEVKQMYS
jgi:hypothetical protein